MTVQVLEASTIVTYVTKMIFVDAAMFFRRPYAVSLKVDTIIVITHNDGTQYYLNACRYILF